MHRQHKDLFPDLGAQARLARQEEESQRAAQGSRPLRAVRWSETTAVMQEARDSYIHGSFATLVLALDYVEHVINDALPLPVPKPGKTKARGPTITDAIKLARAGQLFPADLLDGAEILSDFRNPFIHRRGDEDADTLGSRISSRKTHPRTIQERDAKDALIVMYGFFRYSFTPPLPCPISST